MGSNNNITWTKLHSAEKDELKICSEKSFPVDKKESFSMFKLILDEPQPGCWYCMRISKLEFYGTINENEEISNDSTNEDEVSIIGRLKRV